MTWLRRIRGAIGTGLTWAVGWAIAGLLVGAASVVLPGLPWNAFFEVFDAPLPALAVPGFLAGLLFSGLLTIAGRRRGLAALSLPRFAVLGAIGGLLVTALPFALVALGLASREGSRIGTWQIVAVITGPFVLLSAASAAASLLLARAAARRDARDGIGASTDDLLSDGDRAPLLRESPIVRADDRVAPAHTRVQPVPKDEEGHE